MNTQDNLKIVAQAIDDFICDDISSAGLEKAIAKYGYEPTYFMKLFKSKTGLTPSQFVRYKKMRQARDFLLEGYSTLDAAYAAGLSGQGRLHELFVTYEAASPGMVGKRGLGLIITYGTHPTSIGEVLIGTTDKGLCWLGFSMKENRNASYFKMIKHWPNADFQENFEKTKPYAEKLQDVLSGKSEKGALCLDLHGTNFQVQVWQALLRIPLGTTVSYQAIAKAIGNPKASRAVGGAVGANPIAWIIPCHRVIQVSGLVENYASGTDRKCALLGFESIQSNQTRDL